MSWSLIEENILRDKIACILKNKHKKVGAWLYEPITQRSLCKQDNLMNDKKGNVKW